MYYELKLAFLVYLWYPKTRVCARNTLSAVTPTKSFRIAYSTCELLIKSLNWMLLRSEPGNGHRVRDLPPAAGDAVPAQHRGQAPVPARQCR